jgi:hypothetical protein
MCLPCECFKAESDKTPPAGATVTVQWNRFIWLVLCW